MKRPDGFACGGNDESGHDDDDDDAFHSCVHGQGDNP